MSNCMEETRCWLKRFGCLECESIFAGPCLLEALYPYLKKSRISYECSHEARKLSRTQDIDTSDDDTRYILAGITSGNVCDPLKWDRPRDLAIRCHHHVGEVSFKPMKIKVMVTRCLGSCQTYAVVSTAPIVKVPSGTGSSI